MPEPNVAEQPLTNTETYADFKTKFDEPASAAPADVEVNPHGTEGDKKTSAAAGDGEPKPDDGSDPLKQQDKVEKRKQQIQRDIDQQVARREAAKREADAEEARLSKLRGGPSPKDSAPPGAAPKPFDGADAADPEPNQANFTDYQEWLDARAAWIGRKEFRKLEHVKSEKAAQDAQAAQQQENERSYKSAVSDFEARGTEYAQEHEDYPELVDKLKGTKISPETEAFLLWGCEGTEGPQMLHGLMKDPDKLKEIEAAKTPIARFNALYKFKYENRIADLEGQLASARQTPAAPKKSSAPPAGTNLRTAGAAASVTTETATSYEGFKKAFDKKEGLRS